MRGGRKSFATILSAATLMVLTVAGTALAGTDDEVRARFGNPLIGFT
jgi:hypothetical protein